MKRFIIPFSILFIAGIFIYQLFFTGNVTSNSQEINTNNFEVNTGSSEGDSKAKINVIVFSDYGCQACKILNDDLVNMKFKENYIDKQLVRYIFKHIPMEEHKNAYESSAAAIAAENQDRFWDMSRLLFDNASKLGKTDDPSDLYKMLADQIGLDKDEFNDDLDHEETKEEIRKTKAEFKKLGFQGTPILIIGTKIIYGAPSAKEFKETLDSELKKVT
ncbi:MULTISPECIES: DsbA family protein [Bacillus]|uniref:DsbA family protein n=1 Tax=Bacillus rugosus TaxID=2715209 RepID=A0ACD3ZX65_9BACI|nr:MULTISPECIES: thioredoxin domain-containing protein [Bacillus]MBY4602455.1 DsbA family protein [Bacillus sp. SPARC3]UPV78563.1 DsbA family protein [Bacillus rugosus]